MFLEEKFGWTDENKVLPMTLGEGECILRTSQGIFKGRVLNMESQIPFSYSTTSLLNGGVRMSHSSAIASVLIDECYTDTYADSNPSWNVSAFNS